MDARHDGTRPERARRALRRAWRRQTARGRRDDALDWRPLPGVARLEHRAARPLADDGVVVAFRSRHRVLLTTEVQGWPTDHEPLVWIRGDEVPQGWVELMVDDVVLPTVRGCHRAPDGIDPVGTPRTDA